MSASFRTRLTLALTITVSACIAVVAVAVSLQVERTFERADHQRSDALASQVRSELERYAAEVERLLDHAASTDSIRSLVPFLTVPEADTTAYVNEAEKLAQQNDLDFLDIVKEDGTIISSAHWPARFGYKEDGFEAAIGMKQAFLRSEDLPSDRALAMSAVRKLSSEGGSIYLVGGKRIDTSFVKSLVLPQETQLYLYRFHKQGGEWVGANTGGGKLAEIVERIRAAQGQEDNVAPMLSFDADKDPSFQAIPLRGANDELLGAIILRNSHAAKRALVSQIRWVALLVGLGGILAGMLISRRIAMRVTQPVEDLAAAAARIQHGDWQTRVDVESRDEIGHLAEAFNSMTADLVAQRDRLLQAERVAAWRELARRLAHELKNPLFPIQITVENLVRARRYAPEQFEEIFRESTETLQAEIKNLQQIVGRFSDFSKMPVPQRQATDLNKLVRGVVQLFRAQFQQQAKYEIDLQLADPMPEINVDPILIRRVLENLVLNAVDAMPEGGRLTLRTAAADGRAIIALIDTGAGLTPEECERLFTPYYTTKQHGTGLGLAIVQSIIADHGGTISVKSEKGSGSTFVIELPIADASTAGATA